MSPKTKFKKNRPGPKPKMISLYPFTFDEVLDTVIATKPRKIKNEQDKKGLEDEVPVKEKNPA